MKQQQRLEATEDRRLQSKALRAWEKQKVAWEQMRHRLLTETGKGGRERGIARNFAMSAATTRERMEDYGMISAGVPQSALNSFYAWESLLRRTNESEALRYVQIGKGYYPYALFGEVRDPTAIKKSHPVFTRVVHDIPRGPLGEESEEGVLASARRSRDVARTAISMENEEDGMRLIISSRGGDDLLMTSTNTDAQMDYYTQQLRRFAPHLKSRFSHFLVPRDFLQVEGGPVPFLSQREAEQMQAKMMEEGEEEEDPVQFFPPPQQIRISSALGATSQPSGSAPNTRKGEDERSTAGLSEGDGAQGSGLVGTGTAISEEEAAPTTVPSLRISTRRLLFRAQPGELTHGYVVVDNPSSVTVYYSWMPVDLMQEGVAEEAEEEHRRPATSASADGSAGHGTPRAGSPRGTAARAAPAPAPPIIPLDEVRRCVHRMADKSRMARSYFRLSSPINGVFLPDDSEVFPFSLRSPHPGRFKHTFELLTVPPSPERIIIELSAIVEANETSADTLYKPVEAALNAKVAADAQRSLVHRLLNNNTPYEGAEIESSIKAVHEAKEKAQQADKARNTSQKQRWHAANQHTLDLTPYNRQVYEKLAKLYTNLHQAMEGLGMAQSHTHWDGSINSLISDVVDLRDAPSRNLYHEAIMVLLRAARVSQNDAEPLEVLLQRAAEELANHVGKRLLVMHAEEAEFSQLPREPIVPVMSGKKARAMSAAGKRHASAGGPGGVGAKNDKNAPIDVPQPGTLRRSSKVVWTAEEQEALDQELDVLIATRTALVEGEGPARAAMYLASFRRLVDAACDLHLLDVVQGSRVADLRTLQTFDEMEVDTNAEIVIQKPTKKR